MTPNPKPTIQPLQTVLEPMLQESMKQLTMVIDKEMKSLQEDMENLLHVIDQST